MARVNYQEYLKSQAWHKISEQVRKRARQRCERCRDAKVSDIHHLTYARLGGERLSDLIALCRLCHRSVHGIKSPEVSRHEDRRLRKAFLP